MKTGQLTQEEKDHIIAGYVEKNDKTLAAELNRPVSTVTKYRQSLGIKRLNGGAGGATSPESKAPNQSFTEDERKAFFKGRLTNSLFYETLKHQFTDDEIRYYLEEYGSLCVQFEDIVATEQRQIDEYIKAQIMGNRILRNIRIIEDEVKQLVQEIEVARKSKDMATDEDAQENDNRLMILANTLSAQSEAMSQHYQKNVDTKNKLLEHLNSRRVDRLDQIKRGGTTFIGLVEQFQKREIREREGRYMELVKMAKDEKKNEWRKISQFPDGKKDCILLDEFSEKPEENIVITTGSKHFNQYSLAKENNILIIEDDIKKSIYLQKKLKDNNIDLVKNSTDAIDLLKEKKYQFICLGNPAFKFVEHINSNELCKNSDFIIHADKPDILDQIHGLLNNKRNIEKYPFEELIRDSSH